MTETGHQEIGALIMKKQSEKAIERYCQQVAREAGGVAVKFSSPSNRGVPDRMILKPGGKVGFLELKSTGRKPTKLQQHWLDRLTDLGFKADYKDSKEGVKAFIEDL